MSEDLPSASLVGVPQADGDDWRGHAFVPGRSGLSLRGAVGSTLMFATVKRPEIHTDPEAKQRYQSHGHDYQDCELVVNGETYPAFEVRDTGLGIRVRAADVSGYAVVAVVPVGDDVPGVSVEWPDDGN